MGNSNSSPTNNPSTGSRPMRTDTHQDVSVPTSSPYPGLSSPSQSRSTDWNSYSSSIQIREDDPRNISTSLSSSTATATSSGARPKQYRTPSDPLNASGSNQTVPGYPSSSRLSTPSKTSGTSQQSSAANPGTSRSNAPSDPLNASGSNQTVPGYPSSSRLSTPSQTSGTSQQSSAANPGTSRSNGPSYTSGTSQQRSATYSGTRRINGSSSKRKVPLYMAASFSGLCERIDRGIDWSNVSRLAEKAAVVMRTANKAYKRKDEEQAYILYERYARMWEHIRKSRAYKNKPITFDKILPRTNHQTACDRIAELEPSLESRYSKRPLCSSQVPRGIPAQTPLYVSRNTNSAVGQPQRQTSQPLEPLAMNMTPSFYTSSADSALPRPSASSRSARSAPSLTGRASKSEHSQATGTSQQQQSSAVKQGLKGMRENLLCPICLDLFENAKSLLCGHATCEECIGEWVASKGGVLTCPTCKTEHSLPSNGVAGLVTNFALNNLVEELKKLDEEGPDIEVSGEEEQPTNEATMPSLVEELQPNTTTFPSLMDMVTPQQLLSSKVPSAENSFLEKITRTGYKDVKGSTIGLRIQLCDTEGDPLRGRTCDKVKATVLTPSEEIENVSVSLLKRDGDYSLSFIPSKIGVHFVEAYLDNDPVCGSPFRVVVHPSAKFDEIICSPMNDPKDLVVYGSMIYATDDCEDAYLCTDWESDWSYPCENRFDEDVDSFGIDAFSDRFYVTVPNKCCVYVYDLSGGYLNNFGKRFLESPTGIAVSSAGTIYVADTDDNTIEVFRRNFSHMHSIQAGGNANHCSLALLALSPAEDRLIAADQGTACFKIFDVVDMRMLKMIKTEVQHAPARPFGVEVDEDGNILVSVTFDPSMQSKRGGHNQQKSKRRKGAIITYNSEGYFLGIFGDKELKKPRGLSIVEDKIVVVDEGARDEASCLKVYKL